MNFFEHQDRARRRTGRLVALFAAAVVGIIALVYLLAVVLLPIATGVTLEGGQPGLSPDEMGRLRLWDPLVLAVVAGGVLLVVGSGSLYKVAQLRGGGSVVAEQLGGRLVSPETADLQERRLLNVVEEMAIASGVPVPPVYLMDKEVGINAFAAGYSPRDAVIGLSRDELQGVMAHEFSHILNGDMRMNIRLIGILHGILVIGLIGSLIFRSMIYAPRTRSRSRGDGGGGAAVLALIAFGVGLAVIGFVGTFFGNLIKASVSRQREFLADASAVQFTRNPEGIGGALKKIGGLHAGSKIRSGMASEASHMFFAAGLSSALGSLTATHPPLPLRIRRIDPRWDGTFPEVAAPEAREPERPARERHPLGARAERAMAGLAGAALAESVAGEPTPRHSALEDVGTLSERSMRHAAQLIDRIPEPVADAAREPFGARAVVLAMLLDEHGGVRDRQIDLIRAHDDGMARAVARLRGPVASMPPELRLPTIDIAIGALRAMTKPQYERFRERVAGLIAADEKRDLFEWVLLRILRRHLDAHFGRAEGRGVTRYYGLQRLTGECRVLLSTLAYAGHRDRDAATRAFDAGARRLPVPLGAMAAPGDCGLGALDDALDKLDQISAKLKKGVLTACAACIAADREVTVREGELLRAIADDLDCPMPPLLPGQPLV